MHTHTPLYASSIYPSQTVGMYFSITMFHACLGHTYTKKKFIVSEIQI